MPRRAEAAPLLALALDRQAGAPLNRQLYDGVRAAILTGRLAPGAALPSSRALARDLGIARNTVLAAFDQLASEGYVEGRAGSGTVVSRVLPDTPSAAPGPAAAAGRGEGESAALSRRGRLLAAQPWRGHGGFAAAEPDCSAFPFELWARLLARPWRRPGRDLYAARHPGGHAPLRAAIAQYLRAARSVRCEAEQVIV
ncbi:MAG: GntR family transcriptional regulator, partial [Rhodospirillaceae bacterium]|nr:GntR family transcriptional regulator [Rhodospirillaceae bacterium]